MWLTLSDTVKLKSPLGEHTNGHICIKCAATIRGPQRMILYVFFLFGHHM